MTYCLDQPRSEGAIVTVDPGDQGLWGHPLPICHLGRVRDGIDIHRCHEHVIPLVLDQTGDGVRRTVDEHTDRRWIALDSQLLLRASPDRIFEILPRPRMRTAGIGPDPAEVILLQRPTLQQDPTVFSA